VSTSVSFGALVGSVLTNQVGVLYHSLTETIPGVRSYTNTDQVSVETAQPAVSKSTEPFTLRVGDVVTYHVVFTIPAGTVWSGNTLLDGLNPGLWYITDSETLTWTPSTVHVTITDRVSNTTEHPGHQIIRWYFAPITSEQEIPTVVTLTFRAQAVGLRIDNLEPVWITQTEKFWPSNYVQLEFPWPKVVTDVSVNMLIQPYLEIAKESTPPPGTYVGAGDRITYTLTVTNSGYGLAYDIVISDILPAEMVYVTSSITSSVPPYIAFLSEPAVGTTGVLSWQVNELWGREWTPQYESKVATITVVAEMTDTVGANLTFTNTATLTTSTTQTTLSDSWTVEVRVPACPVGCTLTQGYWKTHTKYGPAKPRDDAWDLIGEDTTFYLSGQSYYRVLWTPPSGGNPYYQLAHQFIAATLNKLNGAATTPQVEAALAWAHSFFSNYPPNYAFNRTLTNQARYYAGLLAQYNEGYIGPGHCSE
jgi:uncharacterized repeat protein (TIGR01451 family)